MTKDHKRALIKVCFCATLLHNTDMITCLTYFMCFHML